MEYIIPHTIKVSFNRTNKIRTILTTIICLLFTANLQAQDDINSLFDAAIGGSSEAQCTLGRSFYKGINGAKTDLAESLYWYEMAAEQNNDFALFFTAKLYYFMAIGSVESNYPKSKLYRTALYWSKKGVSRGKSLVEMCKGAGMSTTDDYYKAFIGYESEMQKAVTLIQKKGYTIGARDIIHAEKRDYKRGMRYNNSTRARGNASSSSSNNISNTPKQEERAHIKNVKEEFDVYQNGVKGMYLVVDFDISGMKGKQGKCIAYIYNINNTKFINSESNGYQTSEDQICGFTIFSPPYESTVYTGLRIFIPYSALRVNNTSRVNVKAGISIYDITDSKWIDDGMTYSGNFHVTW